MDIVAAILCDFASVRAGLLTVVGGGVTRLWRDEYPAPLGVFLAVMLECSTEDLRRPHELQVSVITADGAQLAHVQGGFATEDMGDLDPGETTLVPIPLSLQPVGVPGPGRYSIHLSVDDDHHQTLAFRVAPRPVTPQQ